MNGTRKNCAEALTVEMLQAKCTGQRKQIEGLEAEVARLLKALEEIGKVPINIGTESADYVRGAEDEGRVLRNMANAARGVTP